MEYLLLLSLTHCKQELWWEAERTAGDRLSDCSSCRRIWKERDTTICMKMQKPGVLRLNNSHVGRRIEILSEFGGEDDDDPDGDNIMPKTSVWCKGTITEVYKDSESTWIPEVGYPETRAEAEFPSYDYNNGNEMGSWRFLVEIDYGVWNIQHKLMEIICNSSTMNAFKDRRCLYWSPAPPSKTTTFIIKQ